VRLVDAGFGIGMKPSWELALDEVRAQGGVLYAHLGGQPALSAYGSLFS
jgi:1-aminocyclopropane-1-carboxylate deaminase/D-cysteine desulfhydrase-like pyridoxal-dependent ACC family enzyme